MLFVFRCGHLKLADFGSATRLSSLGNAKGSMPIGTTDYIAPEILMALENPKKFTHGVRIIKKYNNILLVFHCKCINTLFIASL